MLVAKSGHEGDDARCAPGRREVFVKDERAGWRRLSLRCRPVCDAQPSLRHGGDLAVERERSSKRGRSDRPHFLVERLADGDRTSGVVDDGRIAESAKRQEAELGKRRLGCRDASLCSLESIALVDHTEVDARVVADLQPSQRLEVVDAVLRDRRKVKVRDRSPYARGNRVDLVDARTSMPTRDQPRTARQYQSRDVATSEL
jgi:hypothetical protein